MTRLDLLNRTVIAAALVALAIAVGVWLTRAPLAAAPVAAPVRIAPEPTLAPPPVPVRPTTTVIEVPVEVEIAAAAEPPAAIPAEATSKPRPIYQHRRRGLFRHW